MTVSKGPVPPGPPPRTTLAVHFPFEYHRYPLCTTLAVVLAILNSLRMGFRTLAIQKRSSEV